MPELHVCPHLAGAEVRPAPGGAAPRVLWCQECLVAAIERDKLEERQACAALADEWGRQGGSGWWTASKIADAILARGSRRKKGGP